MSDKVLKLQKRESNEEAIAMLKEILSKAESGELVDFHLVGKLNDGKFFTGLSMKSNDMVWMVGALQVAQSYMTMGMHIS